MQKILLATIGFGTWLCLAACGSGGTSSGPSATGGSVGLGSGGAPASSGGAAGVGSDAGAVVVGSNGGNGGTAGTASDGGAVVVGSAGGVVAVGPDAGAGGAEAGGGSATSAVSCDFIVQGMHVCTGFSGLAAAALVQEQSACAQQNQGTFAQAACVSTNASGTCKFVSTGTGQFAGIPAGTAVTYVWYSLPASQITGAQMVCTTTLGGTWSGG